MDGECSMHCENEKFLQNTCRKNEWNPSTWLCGVGEEYEKGSNPYPANMENMVSSYQC